MKHAIACLNTQLGILLHNASVFHGEGREEDRDRNIAEAYDTRAAIEILREEIPLSERTGLDPADPWEESAKQQTRNADFYRSIVTRIGELYGDAAKRCDDGTMSQDVLAIVVPELVETSVKQFRLLASFVGSKATSHTEIVSDTAAEIRALRTSLEAERQRRIDAERKLEKFRIDYDAKAAEVVELRERVKPVPQEQQYRMLEVGEVLQCGDLFRNTDNDWIPTQSIGEKVPVCGDYLRPVEELNRQYRMLEVGEITQEGDEVRPVGAEWLRIDPEHFGQRINPRETGYFPVGYYRRPVKSEPEYRMLKAGEMSKQGDQVLMADSRPDGDDWQGLSEFGPLKPENVGFVRRPIPLDTEPEKPETPAA